MLSAYRGAFPSGSVSADDPVLPAQGATHTHITERFVPQRAPRPAAGSFARRHDPLREFRRGFASCCESGQSCWVLL